LSYLYVRRLKIKYLVANAFATIFLVINNIKQTIDIEIAYIYTLIVGGFLYDKIFF
jgi:hypothetical protein